MNIESCKECGAEFDSFIIATNKCCRYCNLRSGLCSDNTWEPGSRLLANYIIDFNYNHTILKVPLDIQILGTFIEGFTRRLLVLIDPLSPLMKIELMWTDLNHSLMFEKEWKFIELLNGNPIGFLFWRKLEEIK